jgi:hypothetical protein
MMEFTLLGMNSWKMATIETGQLGQTQFKAIMAKSLPYTGKVTTFHCFLCSVPVFSSFLSYSCAFSVVSDIRGGRV